MALTSLGQSKLAVYYYYYYYYYYRLRILIITLCRPPAVACAPAWPAHPRVCCKTRTQK